MATETVKIATGAAGGKHISNTALTTAITAEAVPALLRNAIDERIVRVRPTSTPVDQISRCAGARHCGSMVVEYYSVDTKPITTSTTTAIAAGAAMRDRGQGTYTFAVNIKNTSILEISETILFPDVVLADGSQLVGYVWALRDGSADIAPINLPAPSDGGAPVLPAIPADSAITRMGRAATELDVMTSQYQALPVKASNNCQIFKMQIEQSTLQKLADKEVDWTFSDQEESAIIDMRLGMEKNFLFGAKGRVYDSNKNEWVYLTGGIWNQTSQSFSFPEKEITEAALISLCARVFTGNNGSKRKILIGGSQLIESINKVQFTRAVAADSTFVRWGIKFREITSNFGSLYVLHSEIFDQCGHTNDAFVLDPEYITKYSHIPFSKERLDLRSSGVRNTDAVVLTEASCLVLRHPDAHFRVYGK